jgi:hypothetical protein
VPRAASHASDAFQVWRHAIGLSRHFHCSRFGPHRKLLGKAREAEYLALTRNFIGNFLAKYSNRFSGSDLTIRSVPVPKTH